MTTAAVNAESRFAQVNSLRLHHLDWGNPAAPALVCVHGFRGNARAFDGFARRYRDRFHVVSIDVRGRGDSDWSPTGDYTMDAYVSDLEGVLEALGIQRFSLVGTSMGGRIGMLYAGKHAERIERFVINDVGPDREAGSDRITAEAANTPASFASLEEAMTYRASISSPLAKRPEAEQRDSALTQLREKGGRWVWKSDPAFLQQRAEGGASSHTESWEVLRRLQCPVLLLHASESDVLSAGQAQRIIEALPNGRLAEVAGVGHAPTLNEPDAVAALEAFFAS